MPFISHRFSRALLASVAVASLSIGCDDETPTATLESEPLEDSCGAVVRQTFGFARPAGSSTPVSGGPGVVAWPTPVAMELLWGEARAVTRGSSADPSCSALRDRLASA